MSDAIKFKCGGCAKKIGVRPEYAGRKIKCPGCKQPLRVPTPRPARSASESAVGVVAAVVSPAAPRSMPDPPTSADTGSLDALYELADMESRADGQVAAGPKAARASDAAKTCPGCDKPVKPGAVICLDCGHNFESGKKLKTKTSKEKASMAASVDVDGDNGEKRSWLAAIFEQIIAGVIRGVIRNIFGR